MEAWQLDHIRKHLPDLLKMTKCSVIFLSHFRADGLISEEEVDILCKIRNMREQAMEFYNIIQTRCRSFNLLKQALAETSQTGAFTILEKCPQEEKAKLQYHGAIGYDKTELLGRGCFGTKVFMGKYGSRDVAVKKIHIDEVAGDMAKEEVKFLKKLDWHENVVRLFEMVETDDFILIALELCDTDLHNWVTKPKAVDRIVIAELEIIAQSARGIGHLHKNRVVHRDLKPANILMVRQATGDIRVKISDFGMAKKIPDVESKMSVHSSGLGTEGWMAPEAIVVQIQGERPNNSVIKIGFPSDIFSLGCIFYFILTGGVHPFGDPFVRQGKIYKGKSKLKEEQIAGSVDDNKSAALIRLVRQMIAKEEADRIQINEVIDCLSDLSATATGPSTFAKRFGDLDADSSELATKLSTITAEVVKKHADEHTQLHNNMAYSAQKDEGLKQSQSVQNGGAKEKNVLEETPLHYSPSLTWHRMTNAKIATSSRSIMNYLVSNGPDPFLKDKEDNTFIHRFFRDTFTSEMKLSQQDFSDIVTYLISAGHSESFNVSGGDYQVTPFHWVMQCVEDIDDATFFSLQKGGVNFNAIDRWGDSILFYAVKHKRSLGFISSLIKFGADFRHLNNNQQGLLHQAVNYATNDLETLKLFLQLGLSVNAVDGQGNTPLHCALWKAEENFICGIASVFMYGADVTVRNKSRKTPMETVSSRENIQKLVKEKVMKLLLKKTGGATMLFNFVE